MRVDAFVDCLPRTPIRLYTSALSSSIWLMTLAPGSDRLLFHFALDKWQCGLLPVACFSLPFILALPLFPLRYAKTTWIEGEIRRPTFSLCSMLHPPFQLKCVFSCLFVPLELQLQWFCRLPQPTASPLRPDWEEIFYLSHIFSLSFSDQQYSWSPSQYFDEDSYSPPPRNMKGLSGGRPAQLQLTSPTSAHTCGLTDCDHSLDHHPHHGNSRPPSYLLSPTESCPLDGHHRCSPRSSIHSECMVMPVSMSTTDHSISSSTFPRMHYGSASRDSGGNTSGGRDSRDDGGSSSHGGSSKMNRIPANLLDQFEKQMPLHRDGFHTLQYQRTSTTTTTTEQRNESPGRIRHLVHSVQKLFTKSHSLEGSSKMNGTKSDSHRDSSHHHHHHHQGHHKHSKRSKSKERKSEGSGKQRSGGWWSSDDNLDSDSTYRTPNVMSRHPVDHISHCYPDSMHSHMAGDLSLKTSKSNNDVKCSACESISMAPEGKFMKRSSWSTLTVSQAKEAYRKSSLNLEKPMMPSDLKPNIRPCHYLQVSVASFCFQHMSTCSLLLQLACSEITF